MKRIIVISLLVFLLLFLFSFSCNGIDMEEEYKLVYGSADESVSEMLGDLGVENVDFDSLVNISFEKVIVLLIEIFKGRLTVPFKTTLTSLGVLIICSLTDGVSKNLQKNDSYRNMMFSYLVLISFIMPLTDSVTAALSSIKLTSDFMLSYIPAFTAVASMSGKTASSLIYSSGMLSFATFISRIAGFLLFPVIAFIIINIHLSFDKSLSLSKTHTVFKKTLTVFLSVTVAVFVGLTNLKTGLAGSADSLAIKGTVIPIIGNSVGDAVTSVLGSMELIKNTVGVFGIIAIILCAVPSLCEMLIWYFCMAVLSSFASAVKAESISRIAEAVMSAISVINVIIIYITLIFILTTGNLLSLRS